MSDKPANADPAIEEQLVAYLDGELDVETSRRIDELLAADPEVRRRLQRLDRTWEVLNELDTPQVAERFTQSTLEMVTVAAAKEVERDRADAPRHRRRRWAITSGGLLAAGLAGFLTIALWPHPNQQLIRDLPLLENLDQYRQIDNVEYPQIDNIEFLRELYKQGLFAQENGDGQ